MLSTAIFEFVTTSTDNIRLVSEAVNKQAQIELGQISYFGDVYLCCYDLEGYMGFVWFIYFSRQSST